jgi:protein TonB
VLAVVVGVVVMTRERPAAPAGGEATATPAPETVEMARQIAQEEVGRREDEMRERLTREILTATPAPGRTAPAAAAPAPRATIPATEPTAVPAAVVPTQAPAVVPPPQPETAPVVPTPAPVAAPAAVVPTQAPVAAPAAVAAAVQRGDMVDSPDTDVDAIFTPKASYPPLARRQRIGGVVILRALIDENGTVQEVQVLRGVKPDLGLDAAATSAVREWRFRPATKGGVPVKVWKTITIPFQP